MQTELWHRVFLYLNEASWDTLEFPALASAVEVSLAEIYALFPHKEALITCFFRRIDLLTLQLYQHEEEISFKDRLLDILLIRLEQLTPYRGFVQQVYEATWAQPCEAFKKWAHVKQSIAWMCHAIHLHSSGVQSKVDIHLITGIYVYGIKCWLKDDSLDLAFTMACLDKAVRQVQLFHPNFLTGTYSVGS